LLLRKFEKAAALRLSFLLSLPVVFVGNIVLNFERFSLRIEDILGLISSFVVGILTIHLLLNLAKRVNFGYFVLIFGVLAIISVFL
jgi:undecaprenyl pyrophosphate phosphatase UppP